MNNEKLIDEIVDIFDKEDLNAEEIMEILALVAAGTSCSCTEPITAIGFLLEKLSIVYKAHEDYKRENN